MILNVSKFISGFKIGSGEESNQSGSIIALVAIFLLPALAIVALVIDHSRQEIALQQLQDCSDAASLAASSKLDGTIYGWKNAKRSAMAVVKNCQILGSEVNDDFRANNDIRLSEGHSDPLEATDYFNGAYYTHNQGEYGNLIINIERGVYWQGTKKDDNGKPKMEFINLESAQQGNLTVEAGVRDKNGNIVDGRYLPPTKAPEFMSMPTYTLANSVQVNVSLKHLDTALGTIVGMFGFGKLTKKATSINDTALEECVAPIAIPACSLMLDTSRGNSAVNNYLTDAYQPETQCERELVVTEAQTEIPAREDGITRSDSFPRPPYYKFKLPSEAPRLNNKAVGLKGVLGVPDLDGKGGAATASELSAHLSSLRNTGGDCFKAKVGMKFKPLDSFFSENETDHRRLLPGQEGFLNNTALEKELADLINDPGGALKNPTFNEVFFDENGKPLPNFPFLRNYRPDIPQDPDTELRITWPLDASGATGEMLMSSMGEGNWTNPMCHSSLVQNANDKTRAKVREITAMVVAPGGSANYCDYPALFAGDYQSSLPATSDTIPVVVGFKKVYFYDFNIMDLEDPKNHSGTKITPYYPSSNSPELDAIDRNPLSTRGYKGLSSSPLVQMDMGELMEQYLADITELEEDNRQCIYQCSTPPDDWEGQGYPGFWDCINACGTVVDLGGFNDWLKNFVLDTTTPEIAECIEDCIAKNPDTEISACDCFGEIEESKSPWVRSCFRSIDRFKGIRQNHNVPNTDPGWAHPFLASRVIDPTNPEESNEYWKDRFFDDPERYYPELVFLAMIVPNTSSGETFNDVESGLAVSIPSYEELISDDGQKLDQFLSEITERIKVPGAETVTYEKFQLFLKYWWVILSKPTPEKYLGTEVSVDNPLGFNMVFPASDPNNVFWHANWNSEIFAVFADIFGKDISAITDPSNVLPVIPGTSAGNSETTPTTNYNAIAEVLQTLETHFKDWKGHTKIALPGRHCLPKKYNNRFPANEASSWQQPKDRSAQYGCGGLRMRLSCDEEQTLLSTKPPKDLNPALVE
jgi:Putative Flp pilus-assembly TadE/G-like